MPYDSRGTGRRGQLVGNSRAKRTTTRERGSRRAHGVWPLQQRPGFLIRRLHQIHGALFQEACGAFEITPLQYSLLSALSLRKTADQTTLAADVALDRTTTTGALKRLAVRKLVERAVSASDRRSRACRLTPAGARLLVEIEAKARAAHRRTIAPLEPAERRLFIALMQRIISAQSRDKEPQPE